MFKSIQATDVGGVITTNIMIQDVKLKICYEELYDNLLRVHIENWVDLRKIDQQAMKEKYRAVILEDEVNIFAFENELALACLDLVAIAIELEFISMGEE